MGTAVSKMAALKKKKSEKAKREGVIARQTARGMTQTAPHLPQNDKIGGLKPRDREAPTCAPNTTMFPFIWYEGRPTRSSVH